jgi:phosphate acetyltransferase
MAIIDTFIKTAQSMNKTIVLPEGQDPRVVTAANKIVSDNIAEVIVLGSPSEIKESCSKAGIEDIKFKALDYLNSDLIPSFCEEFCEIRKKKNMTMDKAAEYMKSRIFFGAMMVRKGDADGLVAGSIASTGDMLRASFMVIGTADGIKTGSSCFVMDLPNPSPAGDNTLIFADCGVNINPDAEQLSDIAISTAASCKSLLNTQAKVAFLSCSTKGSASDPIIDKMIKAFELTKNRIEESGLDIIVDGELQADAAIVPGVAAKKCSDSPLGGSANVLIFPDLNSGNICYKLTERLAGAKAYGPILQGLKKPLNDLSRGCNADDIVGVAAITVCQSASC